MTLTIDPAKMAEIQERWSDRSPEEGTEECICMVCAKMIGADERDPRWNDHDKDCPGCELCEIAVRLWWNEQPTAQVCFNRPKARENFPEQFVNVTTKEMRFHPKCFEEILTK
ncbi:MAG TPA: hypothetical protein VGH22_15430 [Candidatus Binatia bacterium]|jgi:hypothetical protein